MREYKSGFIDLIRFVVIELIILFFYLVIGKSLDSLTTIEYVISELAVFGLSRSMAWIPRNTVKPTGVSC